MTTFDSRFLTLTNCFAHHFDSAGVFRYDVAALSLPPGDDDADDDDDDDDDGPCVVVSDADSAAQRQHHVRVTRVDGELTVTPQRLEVNRGDLVLWSTDGSPGLGFAVRGRIGHTVVDSAAMVDGSVFTHAFGLPGEYRWTDANGSRLGGTVRVVQPRLDEHGAGERHAQWQRSLSSGTVVTVVGERAEPAELEVLVGQTVFWTVQKAPGVSITEVSRVA